MKRILPNPPLSGRRSATLAFAALLLLLGADHGWSQDTRPDSARLPRHQYKSGEDTLNALGEISRTHRDSVVKLEVDGKTVALGAVIDAKGLVITKASEIHAGRLTAWLANGKEVSATLLGIEPDNDVALVRVESANLKPVEWSAEKPSVGQWVITPGTAETPQAIGVVSVKARRIRHPRALIGIRLSQNGSSTRIDSVMDGLGAQKAGLKPGDKILAVNQVPVTEGPDLVRRLREFREGQSVELTIQREQEELHKTVSLGRPKDDDEDRSDRIDRMGGSPSDRAEGFELALQHDTVLKPWMCGGPLLNLDGKTVGINIARAGRVATYALPTEVARRVADQLRSKYASDRSERRKR